MTFDNPFYQTERLYKYSPNRRHWDFPKAQTFDRFAALLKSVDALEKSSILVTVAVLEESLKKIIISRKKDIKKRDSLLRLIEEAVFLNLIFLRKINGRRSSIVSLTLEGRLFSDLWSNIIVNKHDKKINDLFSFLVFKAFWHASFSSGAMKTCSSLDNVHPIKVVLDALVKSGGFTIDQLCKKFYGYSDDVDFLNPERPPLPSLHPSINWEYPMASLKNAKLVKLQQGVKAMRYNVAEEYRPSAMIRPTELLLGFVNKREFWESALSAYAQSKGFMSPQMVRVSSALEDLSPDKLSEVEAEYYKTQISVVVNRLKQTPFRSALLLEYANKCSLCGVGDPGVLEAAHIVAVGDIIEAVKQKQISDISIEEIANPMNGILFCANHHAAYDAGLFDINVGTDDSSHFGHIALKSTDSTFRKTFVSDTVDLLDTQRVSYIRKRERLARLSINSAAKRAKE